jgi:cyclopropane fatty-acyl-phospholipid synthase-like methyltransferase
MIFDWSQVWDRKGNSESDDYLYLSGFDHLDFPIAFEEAAATLTRLLDIQPEDTVLEIGCAAGIVARYLNCHYVGVDKSASMVKKNIALNGFSVLTCEADNLIFRDKSFDKVYCFGVFQYFPSHHYARKVVDEISRVARKAAYIGDLPKVSHDENHLLYVEDFFPGWTMTDALYPREQRFNVVKYF